MSETDNRHDKVNLNINSVVIDESFDYVVPDETFKEHNSHRHHSSRRGNTKDATREELEKAEEGYIFTSDSDDHHHHRHHHHHHHHHRHRRHRRRMAGWKKALLIIGCVILGLVIATGSTYLILNEIGRSRLHDYENMQLETPDKDESGKDIIPADKSGRVITYDGKSYMFNDDVISVTFIGVDDGTDKNKDLHMADAIYTFAVDTKTGKVTILGISRDTMADVDVYSEEGRFIDTEHLQMAFTYAYSSDKVTGGQNTTTSISRLFYGLPMKDHFAINLDALVTLNDTIGGVTLVSSMTFTSPVDGRTIYEGEEVTLHGEEAERYIRTRDTKQIDSNNDRMERQKQYIQAFLQSIVPAAKKDISVVTDLYEEIQSNSETDLGLPEITYIASTSLTKLRSASDIEYVSLKGTITEGEYAELNVSNETAIRTMLDIFYSPIDTAADTAKK